MRLPCVSSRGVRLDGIVAAHDDTCPNRAQSTTRTMTHFFIYGKARALTPIADFRAAHGLPQAFGVMLFEPSDTVPSALLPGAHAALDGVTQGVLGLLALPPKDNTLNTWLKTARVLADFLQFRLKQVNHTVGLPDADIDFTVGVFREVCESAVWAMFRADAGDMPTAELIYGEWLRDSVRVSPTVHVYDYAGERWGVQVISTVYGRVGLVARLPGGVEVVSDPAYAHPAQAFIEALLDSVLTKILSERA